MTEIAAYPPEVAAEVLAAFRELRAAGFLSRKGDRGGGLLVPPTLVVVKNVSGETIPGYACMQATGTTVVSGVDYVEVDKPADAFGVAGGYLFNGPDPIPAGKKGAVQPWETVRALTDGGAISLGGYMPEASEWTVTKATCNTFSGIGSDAVKSDLVRLHVGRSRPCGRFRFTLNEDWSSGVADGNILLMDGTDTGENHDILNPLGDFSDLGDGDPGECWLQDGKFYTDQAPCVT